MPLILLILLLRQQPVADHADPLHLVRDQLKVDVHAARHVDKMASTVPAQMWAKPGADVGSPGAAVGKARCSVGSPGADVGSPSTDVGKARCKCVQSRRRCGQSPVQM